MRIRKIWGDLSIGKKLALVMLVFVFLTAFILTVVYYHFTAAIIKENTVTEMINTLNQEEGILNDKVAKVDAALYDLSTDAFLQSTLNNVDRNLRQDEYAYWENSTRIIHILINTKLRYPEIKGVFAFDLHGNVFMERNAAYVFNENNLDLTAMKNAKGSTVWYDPIEIQSRFSERDSYFAIPAGKVIYNPATMQIVGYIVVYVEDDYLLEIVRSVSFYEDDIHFLYNTHGKTLPASSEYSGLLSSMIDVRHEIQSRRIGRESKYAANWRSENSPFGILMITRDSNHAPSLVKLRYTTIVLLSVTGLLSIISILLVARSISRPILDLVEDIQVFAKGDFSVQVSAKYNDEIGILRRNFNKLVTDIQNLVNNVYRARELQQEAQLKMLQMQINPHFVFNTLDTINWMAISHGEEDIANVIQSFGYLMRFSLSDKELIPFEEELEAVEKYMVIQKYRYGNDLEVQYDIEEETIYEEVPPHILLPLIENSLAHGLKDRIGIKKIQVASHMNSGNIEIEITDNGCGMTDEQLKQIQTDINTDQPDRQNQSIGLRNVNSRLKLKYGENARLNICSTPDEGTKISFSIPCVSSEELEERSQI